MKVIPGRDPGIHGNRVTPDLRLYWLLRARLKLATPGKPLYWLLREWLGGILVE